MGSRGIARSNQHKADNVLPYAAQPTGKRIDLAGGLKPEMRGDALELDSLTRVSQQGSGANRRYVLERA